MSDRKRWTERIEELLREGGHSDRWKDVKQALAEDSKKNTKNDGQ